MNREVIPLRERKIDWPILFFFWLNILFITYMIDIEQLVIKDPSNFDYPIWPPRFIIDMVHWWGNTFDPVLMERPVWWQMTIWIDQLFFGPFYICAIYAYTKGKDWIRIPSIIWASVMLTNVTIILGEEIMGSHPTHALGTVLFANASWVLFPIYVIWRMYKPEYPFTRAVPSRE